MSGWEKLEELHLDVLREIGNIGTGNAATSLGLMLNRRVDMNVPDVRVNSLAGLMEETVCFRAEEKVICNSVAIAGDIDAVVLFLINEEGSLRMVERLLMLPEGSADRLDSMGESALKEIGNIVTAALMSALSDMTGLNIHLSVPAFSRDMFAAVMSSALLENGFHDDRILIIKTALSAESTNLDGYFMLLPREEALERIFETLGIK